MNPALVQAAGRARAKSVARTVARTVRRPRIEHNVLHFYLEILWQGIIVGGICYYLPIFLVRLGATPLQMSVYTALPQLATLLFSLPAAVFVESRADRIRIVGIARLTNVASYPLVALAPLALAFSNAEAATWFVIAVWSITGIALAFSPPAWTSVYAETVPPDRRPAINGHRFALFNLSSAGGVALFGLVLDRFAFPGNYQSVFVLSFIAGALSIYHLSRVRLPKGAFASAVPAPAGLRRRVSGLLGLFTEGGEFTRFTVAVFVYRLVLAIPSALFAIFWVRELGATDAWLGYRSTAAYLAQMLSYFALGRLATRRGHRAVLTLSTAGLALYPVLTAVALSPEWLIPAAMAGSFFTAGLDISLFEAMLANCPGDRRPSSVAVNNAAGSAAGFLGPLIGVALAGELGLRGTFYLAGALTLASSALFVVLGLGWRHRRRQAPGPAVAIS